MWLFFFFSSGRRHTRWPRDWSSDVCSSDLSPMMSRTCSRTASRVTPRASRALAPTPSASWIRPSRMRSEERRVGKEYRARRGRDREKREKELDGGEEGAQVLAKRTDSHRYH